MDGGKNVPMAIGMRNCHENSPVLLLRKYHPHPLGSAQGWFSAISAEAGIQKP